MKNIISHIGLFLLLLNTIQAALANIPEAPFVPFTVKYSIDIGESEWVIQNEADLKYLNEVLNKFKPTSNIQVTQGGKVDNYTPTHFRQEFITPDEEPPLPPPAHAPSDEVHSASAAASRSWLPETFALRIGSDGQFADSQTSEYQSFIAGATLKVIYDRSTKKADEFVEITSWDSLIGILNTLKRRNVYSVSIKFKDGPVRYISVADPAKVSFNSSKRVTFK